MPLLQVRLSDSEHAAINARAKTAGLSVASLVKSTLCSDSTEPVKTSVRKQAHNLPSLPTPVSTTRWRCDCASGRYHAFITRACAACGAHAPEGPQ